MYMKIPEGKQLITPDKDMTYMGRIDLADPKAPVFYWAGSYVRMRFTGTSVSAVIFNRRFFNRMSLGCVLDGREFRVDFGKTDENEGEYLLKLADDLEDGEHDVILFKRQDSSHYYKFLGFIIDEGAQVPDAPALPARRIECFGDSVSAGAVVEAVNHTAKCDPDGHMGHYDNAWRSYASITARNLGAQLHDTAQGGIAIFDKTGWFHAPNFLGMETAYDKLCYYPEGEKGYTDWDFSRYIPHVVIFAVGQNDSHNEAEGDPDIADPVFRRRWKDGYKKIIVSLREKYPKARFILLLTVLCHDPEWDKAIDEITQELADEKISHFMFTRTGKATPGHPRISEQYEMAEELTAYISNMGDSVWE
ncbi:GDSL-type esterase/lipase family protein [uncultured Ruminococcus sp.]|uniref:GDSL-type esterase/lipase family protein n=1 Tax=uncultured Ruminococcus sp. TaxID=165186 RepID=UPI0025CCF941|nr:GDSL-type esterase/lipase family protein [uncultured Ruminococcus sp.]